MEWRCPVCGCNPRVGARNFDLLKEGQRRLAEAQVALAGEVVVREVPIDISYLEDYL